MISCIKFWNDYEKCRQAKKNFIKCEKKYDMLEKCWLGYWCLTILLCLPFERRETYCFSLIFSSSASSASSQRGLSRP